MAGLGLIIIFLPEQLCNLLRNVFMIYKIHGSELSTQSEQL